MSREIVAVMPARVIEREPLEIRIGKDGESNGRLLISQGTVEYIEPNCTYGRRVSWDRISTMFRMFGVSDAPRSRVKKVARSRRNAPAILTG